MTRFTVAVLVVSMLVGSFAIDSMAQSKVDDPFRFSIGVTSELTDNRDSTTISEDNIDHYIGPKFSFRGKPGDASSLDLVYNPLYRYRTKPAPTQNTSELYHNASLNFKKRSSEITEMRIVDSFNYTDDPSVSQGGTLLRRDSSYLYNMLEIGMHRRVRSADTLDVSGSYSLKRYDEQAVAAESDEDRYALKALYLKQYQRKSALAFDVQVGGTTYEEANGVDRSFTSVIGAIGLEHISSPNLRMGARVGGQVVDYAESTQGTETSPTLNLAITGNTIPTVMFSASVDHRIRESDVFPFASQTATDFRGDVEMALKEKSMVLRGSVTYHIGEYTEDSLPGSQYGSISGDETGVIFEGGLTYKYNNETQFGVLVRLEDVSSDDQLTSAREFTRNSVAVSATKQF